MVFETLRTIAFRNLIDAEVSIQAKDVFLVGENGQGKTNFLEALYFCSYASSFRGVRDVDLVRNGEKNCAAAVKLVNSPYDQVLIKLENGRKSVEIDGKRVEDRKELLKAAPCIVFCHEDMEFVAGSPERRRWFFDQSQSLYDQVYLDDLRKYRKVLKIRNTILREGRSSGDLLDALDPQIADYGIKLMEKREEAVKDFSVTFGCLYREISGIDGIGIRYAPSWKERLLEKILIYLAEHREGDIAFGSTLSGPHRDRYIFTCKGIEFASKASTGQRRLLALLLRTAQAQRFFQITGQSPVLLLDDVLLELDPEKRRNFLAMMPVYDQAFYTFLPEEQIDRYYGYDSMVYNVTAGCLSK
ncbi:MAG: DNA replication and repair protein RecF [Treponema sp.]|nr:DNA replication and repair protein RecF [Treponema sp.]